MNIPRNERLPAVTASPKRNFLNAPQRSAKKRRLSRNLRALSFGLAMAALSSTAHAASGTWTNGDANNVWQDNLNWSVAPFPGNTTAVFTSTDTATFGTTGSGTITLGGTGIINVQSILFGTATTNANVFTVGAATDTFEFTGAASQAAGGVFLEAGVTNSEQIGVAGTTLNISTGGGANTTFANVSTTAGVNLNVAGNIGQTGTNATNLFFAADGAGGSGGLVNVTGNISNSSTGALTIYKRDTNTVTLAGTVTTGNGAINVRQGVMNLNGAVNTGTAGIAVTQGTGSSSGSATLNIAANVTSTNFVVGQGLATVSGATYQTAGTVTFSAAANATDFQVGAVSNPGQAFSGYYKLSGGSLTANEFGIAGGGANGNSISSSVGVMDVTGGTATTTGYLGIGRAAGATSAAAGLLNVTGGTVLSGTAGTTGPIDLNWGTAAGALGVLNVGGGSGAAAVTGGAGTTATGTFAGLGLNLASTNTAGTQGIANLLTNGTLTVTDVVANGGAAATSHLNFNGGTLKAAATNLGAAFITDPNISAINVYSGGGTIDNSGTAITISHALVAPAGQGVSATTIAVPAGGSGYIGVPLVKLTGGTGVGATAVATVNASGVVTGIRITSPGIGYTAGDTLTATFFGGVVGAGGTASTINGTQATAVTGIAVAANTSGGLTFVGTGTTTLTAANTYAGATTVNGGTLLLAATGSLASNSVNVTNSGTLTLQGTTTLADTSILTLVSGTKFNLSAATGSETIRSLVLDGAGVTPGTYTAAQLTAKDGAITFTTAGETLTVTSAIPEPSTWVMMLGGLAGLVGWTARRKRCA